MFNTNNTYNLSDSVIAQIAKLVQLAVLTGTDIVDHMRMIKLVTNGTSLDLDKEYEEMINNHIQAMLNTIQQNGDSLEEE